MIDSLVATGYLRNAGDTSRPDFVTIKNVPGYYYQTLEDTMTIVASSTLGLTVQCAKCHTHKYDPITQADYYRLQAVFMSGYRPVAVDPQVERKRPEATAVQEARAKAISDPLDASIARRVGAINAIRSSFAERRFADIWPGSPRRSARMSGSPSPRPPTSGTRSSATSSASSRPSCVRPPRRSRVCSTRSLSAIVT